MNAYDYLKSLIDDGYFDDRDRAAPNGLRRLTAASAALLYAKASEETIFPEQQEQLIQYWHARQLHASVEV